MVYIKYMTKSIYFISTNSKVGERTVLGYDYRKTIPRLAGITYVSSVRMTTRNGFQMETEATSINELNLYIVYTCYQDMQLHTQDITPE
jgi:hypothetical protein